MTERIKERTWQSIHTDYIEFAVLSYRASKENKSELNSGVHLNRNVVDTIRYSYDCLEASVEFIYHMGLLRQLPVKIQDNWLARNVCRKWNSLSLSDRIGMVTYAWLGEPFWRSDDEYRLFEDLKRVRDGLTHPVPVGTELEEEILFRQEFQDGTGFTKSRPIGEPKQIGSANMNFRAKGAVAHFNQNPRLLEAEDAEQALEIILCHLSRLERIFFGRVTTWFAFYNTENNGLLSTKDLLNTIDRCFENIWSAV